MLPKDADSMANGIDPGQIVSKGACTVCSYLSRVSALIGIFLQYFKVTLLFHVFTALCFKVLIVSVFPQVTNQLVMACKEYIKNCTLTMEDEDKLWDRIQEEIEHRDTSNIEVDPKIKLLKSQVESKLKVCNLFCCSFISLCVASQPTIA